MIKDLFDQFFSKYNGKDVEAEDSSNLNQCFDLAFLWCDSLGIPRSSVRHLYAYQIFTQPTSETKQYFKLITNSPDGIPQVGDLVIFGTKVGTAGHVCISNGTGDTKTFQSLDQNWGTTPSQKKTRIVTHNYTGCLGWLRPILITKELLENKEITWDDFEGNRHTVKWYCDEWQQEKEKNIEISSKYAEDLKVKQEHIESLQRSGADATARAILDAKRILDITTQKESLVGQLERAREDYNNLVKENEELAIKVTDLGVLIGILEAKMEKPKDKKQITFQDIINFVKSKINKIKR